MSPGCPDLSSAMGKILTTVTAVCLATLASTATAGADSIDDAFITTLAKYGLSCANFSNCQGRGNAQMIRLGKAICTDFRNGRSASDEFSGLMKSNLSSDQAEALMGASVAAYCPEYKYLFG
jgi:uncharacterized protein DUF732